MDATKLGIWTFSALLLSSALAARATTFIVPGQTPTTRKIVVTVHGLAQASNS